MPGKNDWLAAGLSREGKAANIPVAGDIAREVPVCHFRAGVGDIRELAAGQGRIKCVAVNDEGIIMGALRPEGLEAGDDTTVEQVMTPGPTTVRASESLPELAERMRQAKVSSILVTTPEGRLLGIMYRDEAERAVGQMPVS